MTLTREGDRLILVSAHRGPWLGILVLALAAFWTVGWLSEVVRGGFAYWTGLVVGLPAAAFGVFLLLPRTVTTTFDLGAREVRHVASVAGFAQKSRTYAFDTLDCLMLVQYAGEVATFMPVMRLRSGGVHALAVANGRLSDFAKLLQDVAAATGLKLRDVKG
jgi:hypothetical protein